MRIPVFVSAPSPENLNPQQELSAAIIQKLVTRYKLEWRALGRSDYPNDLPLKETDGRKYVLRDWPWQTDNSHP